MPKCTCPDFSHTGPSCKHFFFAIFEHNRKGKWDSLPPRYRENPHICLDNDIVFSQVDHDDYSPPTEVQSEIKQPTFPQVGWKTGNLESGIQNLEFH